jgi:hypothetical protein
MCCFIGISICNVHVRFKNIMQLKNNAFARERDVTRIIDGGSRLVDQKGRSLSVRYLEEILHH